MTDRIAFLARHAAPWRLAVAVVLLALLLGGLSRGPSGGRSLVLGALPSGGVGRVGSVGVSRVGLSGLPVGARGSVSGALGAGDPAYRVRAAGGGFWAVSAAQRVSARFGRGGVRVSSGGSWLGLVVRGVGYGASLRTVGPVVPWAWGDRVVYARAGFSEWYVNGPLGLEQGFTVSRGVAGGLVGRGPLTVSMGLSGDVRASLDAGGRGLVLSRGGGPSLRYGGLVASDAGGRALHCWLVLRGRRVLLRVDARGARYPVRIDPFIQQSSKLIAGDESGGGQFGYSVALSADGSTALVGGPGDGGGVGAVWVFVRAGSTWTQQGSKLTGGEESGKGAFGSSVALSAEGSTALIGGPEDGGGMGAAWVFVRAGSTWTQQGSKLTGGEESGKGAFGSSVALSAEASTALIGARNDKGGVGAAWVFVRAGSTWAQQGSKLTGGEESGSGFFGNGVALSAGGSTALIGGPEDGGGRGAAWVFVRASSTWTQQGPKLMGGGESGDGDFGWSVALAGGGATALVGGLFDGGGVGAAWVFTRAGSTWTQQGAKLVGGGENGNGYFGIGVALSGDGATALVGGAFDKGGVGAAWVFTRAGSTWTQQGAKLVGGGESGNGIFGYDVALSGDGATALVGGPEDDGLAGAAWGFSSAGAGECTDSWTNTAGGDWFAAANWSTGSPPGPQDNACITASGTYTVTMTQTAASGTVSMRSLTLGGASGTQTLALASSCSLDAVLTATAGISNGVRGAITLANGGACEVAPTVALKGSVGNAGTITVEPANGGHHRLVGSLTNTGTLAIDASTGYPGAGSQLTNEGTIEVANGTQLKVSEGGSVANEAGGRISGTGGGDLLMGAGTSLTEGAGTTSGTRPVIVDDGKLSYTGAGASQIALRGASSLSGGIASGQSLSIESTCSEEASATAAKGLTNVGTITLTNGDACANGSSLAVSGGSLTNGGRIVTEPSHGGARQIQAKVTNTGTLAIEANTAYGGSLPLLVNEGTIDVSSGAALSITGSATVINGSGGVIAGAGNGALVQSGGTFDQGAGDTSGSEPVILDDLDLDYTEHGSGPIALRGTSTLSGAVSTGQTLALQSSCSEPASVTAAAGFTNNGTLELTNAETCRSYATLHLKKETLTNNGLLTIANPHGGGRTIEGNVINNGVVSLAAGEILDIGGSGNYTQTSTAKLHTFIAGTSDFGSMSVAGAATLAGTLILSQTAPFQGSLGQAFTIVASPALTGAFATETHDQIASTSLYYQPQYAAKEATLRVTQVTLAHSPQSGPPGASVTVSGSGYLPGDTVTPAFTDVAGVETVFSRATVDASGEFSKAIAIPASAALGGGFITVRSTQTGVRVSQALKVT